jgi:NhaA family Na+:H+ antiporter
MTSGGGPPDPRRESAIPRVVRPLQEFLRTEAAGGLLLILAAAAAMSWVNLPFGDSYHDLWAAHVAIDLNRVDLDLSLRDWVNDLLMAVFFFVVGMEIKREILRGELSEVRKAALPVAAALGGMVAPAMIYTAFNAGGRGADGWGIPMATDIAFAVGVLSLLGSRAGDRRVPALWLRRGHPKLGWCWAGNPHTWLGSASCGGRA